MTDAVDRARLARAIDTELERTGTPGTRGGREAVPQERHGLPGDDARQPDSTLLRCG